ASARPTPEERTTHAEVERSQHLGIGDVPGAANPLEHRRDLVRAEIDARVDARRQDAIEVLANAAACDVRKAGREPTLEQALQRRVLAAVPLRTTVEERAAADVGRRERRVALEQIADQRVAV